MLDDTDDFFKSLFIPFTNSKAIFYIIIIGFLVYANSLFNNFVWDDLLFIVNNSTIHSINIPQLIGPNLFNVIIHYRPLAAIYFALIYSIVGENVFFYHFLQIGLHITNTILLFLFITKFFKKSIGLFICLVFLVHPINVESTIFIGASTSVLFFFFGMLALLITQKDKLKTKDFIIIFILLLLSILSKESGACFIFLVILYRFLFSKSQIVHLAITVIAVIFVYGLVRFIAMGTGVNFTLGFPMAKLTFFERLANIPLILLYYFKTFIYPKSLAIDQHWRVHTLDFFNFYLPLTFVTFIFFTFASIGVYIRKYKSTMLKVYIFFLAWFVIGIFPNLQIVPLDMTVADRWFYLPLVGLLCILALGISSFNNGNKILNKTFAVIVILILITLSLRTMIRITNWQSPMKLYSHDRKYSPDSFGLENNLGSEYLKKGEYDLAKKHYMKSIAIRPDHWENWYNLGTLHLLLNEISNAKYSYKKALVNNSKYELAYEQYGKILIFHDNPEKGKQFIKDSLTKFPNNAYLWLLLGIAEYKSGNSNAAIIDVRKSLTIFNSVEGNYIYSQIKTNSPINTK